MWSVEERGGVGWVGKEGCVWGGWGRVGMCGGGVGRSVCGGEEGRSVCGGVARSGKEERPSESLPMQLQISQRNS